MSEEIEFVPMPKMQGKSLTQEMAELEQAISKALMLPKELIDGVSLNPDEQYFSE